MFLCSKFLDPHTVISGNQDGSLYVWNARGVLIHIVPGGKAHGPASEVFDLCVRPPDGAMPVFYVLSGGYVHAVVRLRLRDCQIVRLIDRSRDNLSGVGKRLGGR